jgi:ubiquitin carboxyl-terminal hydrolase 7
MEIDAAMMARVLPKNTDLETQDEVYNTWRLSDWRKMEKKSHGPIFQCGGSPWWVLEISWPERLYTDIGSDL